ncbi:MAG: acetyl-CoA hydrolase/transferase C-terminal domain-containing protein [Porticoccaceae bacterium]
MDKPQTFTRADALADAIIEQVGPHIVLALPLGLGKANHVANALYERVAADTSLSLRILTALTLEKPVPRNELHKRFMAPVTDRLFGGYPELQYALARRRGTLPANIRVEEFFFLAGSQLGNDSAQQDHICANYTHAPDYLLARGINVLGQLLAERPAERHGSRFSLSCNPDLTGEMLAARRAGQADFLFVGEINDELPYMAGGASLDDGEIDLLLAGETRNSPLFGAPKEPVPLSEYAAALQVARLIPDGGTLQIGIGSMGDAVAHALILRHRDNALFRTLLEHLPGVDGQLPENHLEPFRLGLHGVSEMLVEAFLDLRDAGVLTREVDGKILRAAFFLGSRAFYERLREMDPALLDKLEMCSVLDVNELYGDEQSKRRQRVGARFVNKGMMATLLGDVVSDGLENGRVVSGVGGQYNFVSQAFALRDARAIIIIPATRSKDGKTTSNILWQYGNTTIPRHLRDIIVTEYGVADLRGRSDAQVIAAMLNICDSRFQEALLRQAKQAGKIASDYRIPASFRDNTPTAVRRRLQHVAHNGQLPPFPFGSNFTDVEQRLLPLLAEIQQRAHSKRQLATLAWRGLRQPAAAAEEILERMQLASPRGVKEKFFRYLLLGALARTLAGQE